MSLRLPGARHGGLGAGSVACRTACAARSARAAEAPQTAAKRRRAHHPSKGVAAVAAAFYWGIPTQHIGVIQ